MEESAGPEALELLQLLRIELEPEPEPERSRCSRLEGPDGALSRNALRKRRNWERRLAARRSRRADEKRRRKQRRAEAAAARTGRGGEEEEGRESARCGARPAKALVRQRLADARVAGPRLCVDLSVSDGMSAKETSRLAAQIRRLYGSNRRAPRPFHLYLAGLQEDSLLFRECRRMNDGFRSYAMDVTDRGFLELFPADTVVYLTPDAEQGQVPPLMQLSAVPVALDLVDPRKVYVLGGLVDESVRKKVTYLKAREGGVSSARLPIDEHMVKRVSAKNFHSQVLAINQVFDILLSFCDTGSWPLALARGMPPGKGYEVSPETVP